MNTSVSFRHMETTDALRTYAEDKTEALEKYLTDPIEVHWVLSVEKIRHKAEVTVTAKDITLSAHGEEDDMYKAVDLVSDKLISQARKHHEKIKNHKFGDEGSMKHQGIEEAE